MASNSYWREALECALDEAGLAGVIPPDKIEEIARDMRFAAEMESEATGALYIPNPMLAEVDNLKKRHAAELREVEHRERVLIRNIADRYNLDPDRISVDRNDDIVHSSGRTTVIG